MGSRVAVHLTPPPEQQFSWTEGGGGGSAPQGTFGNVRGQFWLSQLVECYGHLVGGDRGSREKFRDAQDGPHSEQ